MSNAEHRSYRMGKRAEKVAATRRRILDATRAMVRDGTFHEASLEDLAVRAGVTRVTIYRTLGSKHGVLQALTWEELARARLDRIDDAHNHPDVRLAVRAVLRENCRMFAELGDGFPLTLELARRDDDMATIIDGTYHGRRHRSMERLAQRITSAGLRAPGWTTKRIVDALLVLTSYEAFETLTGRRGRSPEAAGATLFALTGAFLETEPGSDRPNV